jgi:hypothetical protein
MSSSTLALIASVVMALVLAVYVFTPAQDRSPFTRKTRLDYLEERRDVIYDNLRDLTFEYRAGKYPEEDYRAQREILENEAAVLLQEMDVLRSVAA